MFSIIKIFVKVFYFFQKIKKIFGLIMQRVRGYQVIFTNTIDQIINKTMYFSISLKY